jgi:hypothetical protein
MPAPSIPQHGTLAQSLYHIWRSPEVRISSPASPKRSPRKAPSSSTCHPTAHLNPIEKAFAKFKAVLRQTAQRTREGLWHTIGRFLDLYPPQECRNFFIKAGYAT